MKTRTSCNKESSKSSIALVNAWHQGGHLMLSGCSSKEIARKLQISAETVKVHKKHIYAKLGIKSQSELFLIFLQAQNA